MKTPFTYNVPLTFSKRKARLERRLFWANVIGWLVLGVGIVAMLKLFSRWL